MTCEIKVFYSAKCVRTIKIRARHFTSIELAIYFHDKIEVHCITFVLTNNKKSLLLMRNFQFSWSYNIIEINDLM